jgi:broad specificity phosphatase PhoE
MRILALVHVLRAAPRRAFTSSVPRSAEHVVWIRHGCTEMNEALERQPWGSPGFVDPGLYDTRLSPRGIAQASALAARLAHSSELDDVEVVLSSCLTRALETATLALDALLPAVPRVALPAAREVRHVHSVCSP